MERRERVELFDGAEQCVVDGRWGRVSRAAVNHAIADGIHGVTGQPFERRRHNGGGALETCLPLDRVVGDNLAGFRDQDRGLQRAGSRVEDEDAHRCRRQPGQVQSRIRGSSSPWARV